MPRDRPARGSGLDHRALTKLQQLALSFPAGLPLLPAQQPSPLPSQPCPTHRCPARRATPPPTAPLRRVLHAPRGTAGRSRPRPANGNRQRDCNSHPDASRPACGMCLLLPAPRPCTAKFITCHLPGCSSPAVQRPPTRWRWPQPGCLPPPRCPIAARAVTGTNATGPDAAIGGGPPDSRTAPITMRSLGRRNRGTTEARQRRDSRATRPAPRLAAAVPAGPRDIAAPTEAQARSSRILLPSAVPPRETFRLPVVTAITAAAAAWRSDPRGDRVFAAKCRCWSCAAAACNQSRVRVGRAVTACGRRSSPVAARRSGDPLRDQCCGRASSRERWRLGACVLPRGLGAAGARSGEYS